MLVLYGNYSIAWTSFGGSGTPAPVLVSSDMSGLSDGRSGSPTIFLWGGGTQTTGSYVELLGTITSPLDATAPIGGVGVINVSGLPAGTLVDIQLGTYTQRLVASRRGELCSWMLPTAALNSNSIRVRIYNNVNGVTGIAALQVFAIGEIIVGRLTSVPTLLGSPQEELVDPTAFQRSSGGQLYQYMRKPYSVIAAKLGGTLTTTDAVGGTLATIPSGGNPAGVLDLRTLWYYLATTPVCALCMTPHKGPNTSARTKTAGGFFFDVNMIQTGFMLARPISLQPVVMDQPPLWSSGIQAQEAT